MTDMMEKIERAVALRVGEMRDDPGNENAPSEATKAVLDALLHLPKDIIAVGMNACLDDGVSFVIPKDVTIPFYAVIHAILGDEENGN